VVEADFEDGRDKEEGRAMAKIKEDEEEPGERRECMLIVWLCSKMQGIS